MCFPKGILDLQGISQGHFPRAFPGLASVRQEVLRQSSCSVKPFLPSCTIHGTAFPRLFSLAPFALSAILLQANYDSATFKLQFHLQSLAIFSDGLLIMTMKCYMRAQSSHRSTKNCFTSHPSHKTEIVHACTVHERHAAWYFVIQYFLLICPCGQGAWLIIDSADMWE